MTPLKMVNHDHGGLQIAPLNFTAGRKTTDQGTGRGAPRLAAETYDRHKHPGIKDTPPTPAVIYHPR